jgi:hypothetical protein
MLTRMSEPVLPIDAATGDSRHRDVRAEVLAVVPQRAAALSKRLFWRVVLFLAKYPAGVKLLKRLRGS